MDYYSRGNDFETERNVRPKFLWSKLLLDNYPRGNDFARIKKISTKNFLVKLFSG